MTVAAFKRPGDLETATALREMADRVEAGDIRDVVVVADDQGAKVFWRVGTFDDRWRLLGALEYAKGKLLETED